MAANNANCSTGGICRMSGIGTLASNSETTTVNNNPNSESVPKHKGPLPSGSDPSNFLHAGLQRGLDLKSPSFQQRLGNILRILVAACPLPQASRPQVLVGRELVLAHNLFEFCDGRGDRPDRLRLAPVRISASL